MEALNMRNFRIQLFKIRQNFGRFPDFVIDVETNKNRKSTFGLVTVDENKMDKIENPLRKNLIKEKEGSLFPGKFPPLLHS